MMGSPTGPMPWWGGLLQLAWALFSLFVTIRLFQVPYDREKDVAELEAQGLLVSKSYSARRAFMVEEFEDEGTSYFIELDDGTVLFLSGQYLYDYGQDDESDNTPFPCASFTVRRHRTEGYVVDIRCSGPLVKLDATAPHLTLEEMSSENALEDGQIIRDRSYDDVLKEHLAKAKEET